MSTHYVSNVIMESKDIFVLLKSGCYLTHLSLWEREQATGLSREVTAKCSYLRNYFWLLNKMIVLLNP